MFAYCKINVKGHVHAIFHSFAYVTCLSLFFGSLASWQGRPGNKLPASKRRDGKCELEAELPPQMLVGRQDCYNILCRRSYLPIHILDRQAGSFPKLPTFNVGKPASPVREGFKLSLPNLLVVVTSWVLRRHI